MRWRLVAQELALGGGDDLFAGTPSFTNIKLCLSVAAEKDLKCMWLDVKCTFWMGACAATSTSSFLGRSLVTATVRRWGCIAPETLLRFGPITSRDKMLGLGFNASGLHPSVYWHAYRHLVIAVHVDGFLCLGSSRELQWWFEALQKDLKIHILEP